MGMISFSLLNSTDENQPISIKKITHTHAHTITYTLVLVHDLKPELLIVLEVCALSTELRFINCKLIVL